ncbi:uncharacterized protein LOC107027582 [Solanum pennellii]|uniref:Uncharacterized protein LOC107027582 n=1 Tax=Solanum pennellii TaxID=28526 RepID=A0ABM1HE53_SOLPN|nr:uncharacterized protein LOC107027582 [Solanum pennellii]
MDAVTTLSQQIASIQNMITTHFSNMSLGREQTQVNMVHKPQAWFEVCGGGDHSVEVHVNFPLINVLQEIPKYAKNIMDLVANKSRLNEYATVALTEKCNSRIKNGLPTKFKDSVSFTIQRKIGKCVEASGLCDLGASINFIPTSMFIKLGIGRTKPITIILQLVDLSVSRNDGVIKDVLVQPDLEVPFIFGCPFLAMGDALVNLAEGRLTMRSHDKVEVFDVYKEIKFPAIYEKLSAITVIAKDIEGDIEYQEFANVLNVPNVSMLIKFVEPLNKVEGPPSKLSIGKAPKLELFCVNESLLVILSSDLSEL